MHDSPLQRANACTQDQSSMAMREPNDGCVLQEKEAMGTAGPLALAQDILDDGTDEPFFVLNR